MSCMFSMKDCVPAGAFIQLMAGDFPSPGATPSAAWLYFTGICPPSGNPAMVIVIGGPAGAAGAAPRCPPGACAASATTADTNGTSKTANDRLTCMGWPPALIVVQL